MSERTFPPSPGHQAVMKFMGLAHNRSPERLAWTKECALIMDESGPLAALPPFPSKIDGIVQYRDKMIRRLWDQAMIRAGWRSHLPQVSCPKTTDHAPHLVDRVNASASAFWCLGVGEG